MQDFDAGHTKDSPQKTPKLAYTNFSPTFLCQVSCHPTYWYYPQVFSMLKTCGVNGRWTPEAVCTSVNCPLPVDNRLEFKLLEGFSGISGHSVGSVLSTGCKQGTVESATVESAMLAADLDE